MRVPTSLAILLAAVAVTSAGEITKLEGPPKAEWRVIQADPVITTLSAGDRPARWFLLDEHPAAELRAAADGKTATFASTIDGQFRVIAISGEDVHRVKVVKGPPQPMPPGPDPKPPAPVPPADPLAAKLQAAFDAEVLPKEKKAEAIKDKVELYTQAAKLALDPEVATTGQLLGRVKKAADALHTDTLPLVRKAVRAELQAAMPEDVPLTPESRAKAAAMFTRIKTALEGVK
jgi:hypothetical protein